MLEIHVIAFEWMCFPASCSSVLHGFKLKVL